MAKPINPGGPRWSSAREAKRIVVQLVRAYQATDEPFKSCECDGDGCPKCRTIARALETIARRLEREIIKPPRRAKPKP